MNMLNSPGGDLLRLLGVHMPGQQDPSAVVPPAQGFNGMDLSQYSQPELTGAGLAAGQPQELAPIPKPPHGGLLHRFMSAMMGG